MSEKKSEEKPDPLADVPSGAARATLRAIRPNTHPIIIKSLHRGVVVSIGCAKFAFGNTSDALAVIQDYLKNPVELEAAFNRVTGAPPPPTGVPWGSSSMANAGCEIRSEPSTDTVTYGTREPAQDIQGR